jgi:hypothetical protein
MPTPKWESANNSAGEPLNAAKRTILLSFMGNANFAFQACGMTRERGQGFICRALKSREERLLPRRRGFSTNCQS